jgi:hypothetical protein
MRQQLNVHDRGKETPQGPNENQWDQAKLQPDLFASAEFENRQTSTAETPTAPVSLDHIKR